MKYTADQIPNSRYTKLIDDQGQHQMTWPVADIDNLAWKLVHAQWRITESDFLVASSILSAYSRLIHLSKKDRDSICKALQGT